MPPTQPEYIFDFLTVHDLKNLPRPSWLLDGVIKKGGFAQLHGKEGSWKSFAALNWALSVAAGVEWTPGKRCEQGNVVYIVGEGVDEFWPRVEAWLLHRGISEDAIADHIRFVPEAVQLVQEAHLMGFLKGVHESFSEPPKLTIVDTLSRSMVGVPENESEFMTQVISAVQEIQGQTGGAVLVIHHNPYNEDRGRGSTALPGALDTIVGVRKKNSGKMTAEVFCAKQKNSAEFEPMKMQLVPAGESLVATFGAVEVRPEDLDPSHETVLDKMRQAGLAGVTKEAVIQGTGLSRAQFYRIAKALMDNKLVDKVGPLYIAKSDTKIIRFPKVSPLVSPSHPYRG